MRNSHARGPHTCFMFILNLIIFTCFVEPSVRIINVEYRNIKTILILLSTPRSETSRTNCANKQVQTCAHNDTFFIIIEHKKLWYYLQCYSTIAHIYSQAFSRIHMRYCLLLLIFGTSKIKYNSFVVI